MKQLFKIFILVMLCNITHAQNQTFSGASTTQLNTWRGGESMDSIFRLPWSYPKFPWYDSCGRVWLNRYGDSGFYYHDCHNRVRLLSLKDTTLFGSQTLQQVTTKGSTSTNSISLFYSGGKSLTISDTLHDTLRMSSTLLSFTSNDQVVYITPAYILVGESILAPSNLQVGAPTGSNVINLLFNSSNVPGLEFNNGLYSDTVYAGNLTANRTDTLPDKSGVFALISDLPATPTLQQVTTAGATSTVPITLNYLVTQAFTVQDAGGDIITIQPNLIESTNSFGHSSMGAGAIACVNTGSSTDVTMGFNSGIPQVQFHYNSHNATIIPAAITANHNYTLPDETGTFAMQGDLTPFLTQIYNKYGLHIYGTDTAGVDTTLIIPFSDTLSPNGMVTKTYFGAHSISSIYNYYGTTIHSGDSVQVDTTKLATIWYVNTHGAVLSVSNSDNTLLASPTTGNVVIGLNLGNYNSWTDSVQYMLNGLGSTNVNNAIRIVNTVVATSSVTQQWPGSIYLVGSAWRSSGTGGAQAQTHEWKITSEPTTGTLSTGAKLVFSDQIAGGGYTNAMQINGNGEVDATSFVANGSLSITGSTNTIASTSGLAINGVNVIIQSIGGNGNQVIALRPSSTVTYTGTATYAAVAVSTITYNVSSSSTAELVDFYTNRVETQVGLGVQRLASFNVNSIEKAGIDNKGNLLFSPQRAYSSGTEYFLVMSGTTDSQVLYTTTIPASAISGSMVATVTNSDGSLNFSPTTGNVVGSLNMSHTNNWLVNTLYSINGIGNNYSVAATYQNTTAATASIMQNSPSIIMSGFGWDQAGAGSSVGASARMTLIPSPGATSSDAVYTIDLSVNGGSSWNNAFALLALEQTAQFYGGNGTLLAKQLQGNTLTLQTSTATVSGATALSLLSGSINTTSGTFNGVLIQNTYSETTGTAANNDLVIKRIESGGIGSGAQNFLQGLGGSSGTTEMFKFDNAGNLYFSPQNAWSGSGNPYFLLTTGTSDNEIVYTNTIPTNLLSGTISQSIITQKSTTATGNTTIVIPAGAWFTFISINPVSNETIEIGTSSGTGDVMASTAFASGGYSDGTILKHFFSPTSPTTLYINGASGSVTYQYHL